MLRHAEAFVLKSEAERTRSLLFQEFATFERLELIETRAFEAYWTKYLDNNRPSTLPNAISAWSGPAFASSNST